MASESKRQLPVEPQHDSKRPDQGDARTDNVGETLCCKLSGSIVNRRRRENWNQSSDACREI